jgi:hypothetical protein
MAFLLPVDIRAVSDPVRRQPDDLIAWNAAGLVDAAG